MKKLFPAILGLLLLCSCSRQPATETVNDDLSLPAASLQEEYDILLYIPQDAVLYTEGEAFSGKEYRHSAGDYRIRTQHLFADSLQSAIRQLSGRCADDLTVIGTRRFDLPEYRFAWYENGENHRADLVCDGNEYYSIIFSWPEAAGNRNSNLMAQVFASFGLSSAAEVALTGE